MLALDMTAVGNEFILFRNRSGGVTEQSGDSASEISNFPFVPWDMVLAMGPT